MSAILISLLAAILFRMIATLLLGDGRLFMDAWVDVVFWTLIGVGLAVAMINVNWSCTACALARRLHRAGLVRRLCDEPGRLP